MIFSITEAASHFALCKIIVGVWCVCARVWILWACTGRGQAGTQARCSIFHLCVSSLIYLGDSSSFHLLSPSPIPHMHFLFPAGSILSRLLNFLSPGLNQPRRVQSSSLSPWSPPHPPNHTHRHCCQAWNSMPMMCEWENMLVGYCIIYFF